jgi:demethylmenaquinone methyltransferase / 2-methoxy-6-polyprenyl-1,4-benzoquinol methylase
VSATSRRADAATLPTGREKTAAVRRMFDTIAPRYDLVNRLMTGGLDQRWRRRTIAALGLPPESVLVDLACGTGDLTQLARRRRYRVIGADLSWGMLSANHGGAALLQADASGLPIADAAVDGVVCGYALRNFTDLMASLREAARIIRPGGRIAVLEIAAPPPGPLRTGFEVWFERLVPLLGGLISDADAYRYLPRSTAYLPDESTLRALFKDAGFSVVGHHLLMGGLSQLITGTRAGMPPDPSGPGGTVGPRAP